MLEGRSSLAKSRRAGGWLAAALAVAFLALACLLPGGARAQELLANRSFESPAAPNLGNNLYATIPNWTVTALGSATSTPSNIVRPHSGYCCNTALSTPSGGGGQYLDISGTWGQIRQSFTLSQAGAVRFGGWFSTRGVTALNGSALYLKNSGGTTLATVNVTFTSSDPAGTWKQGQSEVIWLAAGTYHFEAYIPNEANFDLASVVLQPAQSIGSPVSMRECPVYPQLAQGTMAGWNSNAPADSITQDGYYDSNWSLKFWTVDGIGADLQRLAGQASNLTFGPGLSGVSYGTVKYLKPANGSWAASVPNLAAAIGTGAYIQVSFTTASTYEASRLALMASFNFYTPSGTYRQAGYISTSPTFATQAELFRDQPVSSTMPTWAIRPLLTPATTYYLRLYFYDVTATSDSAGNVIWDDWHFAGGVCSSLNPATDSGSTLAGSPATVVANIAANDMVNGWNATLGTSGNATISRQGTWPDGVALDPATGALSVGTASAAGTYSLSYRLCDKGPTPVCGDSTIALTLLPRLVMSKTGQVISDPVNGNANPKAVPGAVVRYCIVVGNPAGNPTASGISLTDQLPAAGINLLSGSLRINGSLATPACNYASGTSGGSVNGSTVEASLPNLPGGGYAGLYYDVTIQ